jgi:Cdc6-like AAA superfamily ATPase
MREQVEGALVSARRIEAISRTIKSREAQCAMQLKESRIDCSPGSQDCIGRKEEVADLISRFQRPQTQAVILGPPGIGKTAFAHKCVSVLSELSLFDKFIWINAHNSITLLASFTAVNTQVSSTCSYSQKWKHVKNSLNADPRVLLIYDNANFQDLSGIPEIDSFVTEHFTFEKASALIISRNEDWRRIVPNCIILRPLHQIEALEMLVKISTLRKEQISDQ